MHTEQRKTIKTYKGKEQVKFKGRSMKIPPDFLTKILKARKACTDVLQKLKDYRFHSSLLYSVKFSITIDGEKHYIKNKNLSSIHLQI